MGQERVIDQCEMNFENLETSAFGIDYSIWVFSSYYRISINLEKGFPGSFVMCCK